MYWWTVLELTFTVSLILMIFKFHILRQNLIVKLTKLRIIIFNWKVEFIICTPSLFCDKYIIFTNGLLTRSNISYTTTPLLNLASNIKFTQNQKFVFLKIIFRDIITLNYCLVKVGNVMWKLEKQGQNI